jgi:hypothetical protein
VFEEHLCHPGVAGWAALSLVTVPDHEQVHRPFLPFLAFRASFCVVAGRRELSYRLHHPEVRRVDGRLILGNLREQPIQKLDREQRVPLDAILAQRSAIPHYPDIDKPGFPSHLGQRLLRKRTGQSAGVGGFAFEDLLGQAPVDHRVGKDEAAAGT